MIGPEIQIVSCHSRWEKGEDSEGEGHCRKWRMHFCDVARLQLVGEERLIDGLEKGFA